jgi:lipopolysaccharide export system protein LptC
MVRTVDLPPSAPGAPAAPELTAWEQDRRAALAKARRQSARMRLAKRGFLALALASGGSVLVFAAIHSFGDGFRSTPKVQVEDSLEVVEFRYQGVDDQNREFEITGARAFGGVDDAAPIRLEQPTFRNDAGQQISAPAGLYDRAGHVLQLSGGFTFRDKDYVFSGPTAAIDTQRNIVRGAEGMEGEGPLGKVRADAYEFDANTGNARFTGNVRGRLNMTERKEPRGTQAP